MANEWLDEIPLDGIAMVEIKQAIAKFKSLQKQLIQAEAVYLGYKNAYDEYCKVLAAQLKKNGVESMKCEDGSMIEVDSQVKASLKKDYNSKKEVADWLESYGLGNLITHQYQITATPAAKTLLESNNIAYDDELSMNTNSVKAFVKGELQKGNITEADIPKGLSWYQYDVIKVS